MDSEVKFRIMVVTLGTLPVVLAIIAVVSK
jgi:hypothetical protein